MTTSARDKSQIGTSGMVLCAGLGTRMQPLTLNTPKPLIPVAGKPLIGHAVEQLEKNGVKNIIINTHYLARQVEEWVYQQKNLSIIISDERNELLETGGGVFKARDLLGSSPFFVLNSDTFWLDQSGTSTLQKMRGRFDSDNCDFLLLLSRHENAVGFSGKGDFFCSKSGQLTRRGKEDHAPYIFAGCYLAHPRALANCPDGPFSMNILWDRALKHKRVWGLIHDGLWLHVGTPKAIGEAEQAINQFQSKQK